MNITIKTIPHKDQRYKTVGDWFFTENGDLEIRVSDMGNPDYEFLVGLHELVEVYLCKKRGITDEVVSAFDKKFEEMRAAYPDIIGDDEPGFSPRAPYIKEHGFATNVEMGTARELGVDIEAYNNAVNAL